MRAFQRAVSQDKVVAVIGNYLSEFVLTLGPWPARWRPRGLLRRTCAVDIEGPVVAGPVADQGMQDVEESLIALPHATDLISKANDHFKYTFHGLLPSTIDAYAFGQTCRPCPCCSPPAGTARCHCRPTARFGAWCRSSIRPRSKRAWRSHRRPNCPATDGYSAARIEEDSWSPAGNRVQAS